MVAIKIPTENRRVEVHIVYWDPNSKDGPPDGAFVLKADEVQLYSEMAEVELAGTAAIPESEAVSFHMNATGRALSQLEGRSEYLKSMHFEHLVINRTWPYLGDKDAETPSTSSGTITPDA